MREGKREGMVRGREVRGREGERQVEMEGE